MKSKQAKVSVKFHKQLPRFNWSKFVTQVVLHIPFMRLSTCREVGEPITIRHHCTPEQVEPIQVCYLWRCGGELLLLLLFLVLSQ